MALQTDVGERLVDCGSGCGGDESDLVATRGCSRCEWKAEVSDAGESECLLNAARFRSTMSIRHARFAYVGGTAGKRSARPSHAVANIGATGLSLRPRALNTLSSVANIERRAHADTWRRVNMTAIGIGLARDAGVVLTL